jgi:hypothetical protein
MSNWFALIWIPYLVVLALLFAKRSVWVPVVLVWVGVLNYRLPIVPGFDTSLFLVGVLVCLSMFLADAAMSRVRIEVSPVGRTIFWATLIYAILIFVSVMVFSKDTYAPKRIQSSLDFSLLFFVTLPCLKSMADVRTLLQGLVVGVFLMSLIGVIGYLLDNPWWGHTIYDDQSILMVRDLPGLTYGQKLQLQIEISRGKFSAFQRMRATTSDPNSLSTTIMLAVPFMLYYWFYRPKLKTRLQIAAGLVIMMTCVYLAASRTGMLSVLICLAVMAWGLSRLRRLSWLQMMTSFGVILVLVVIASFIGDVGTVAYERTSEIEGTQDVIDAHGRMERWRHHLKNVELRMLFIGDGSSGARSGGGSNLAHMDYLTILYRAGLWALVCYIIILVRSFRSAREASDALLAWALQAAIIAYAIVGITQQSSMARGPGYLFWPLIAILASRFLTLSEKRKVETPRGVIGDRDV